MGPGYPHPCGTSPICNGRSYFMSVPYLYAFSSILTYWIYLFSFFTVAIIYESTIMVFSFCRSRSRHGNSQGLLRTLNLKPFLFLLVKCKCLLAKSPASCSCYAPCVPYGLPYNIIMRCILSTCHLLVVYK